MRSAEAIWEKKKKKDGMICINQGEVVKQEQYRNAPVRKIGVEREQGRGHTSQQEGQSQSMGISPEGFFTEDEIFSLQTSAPSESMLARP